MKSKLFINEAVRILGHRGMRVFLTYKCIYISKATIHKYINKELRPPSICRGKCLGCPKEYVHKIFQNLLD